MFNMPNPTTAFFDEAEYRDGSLGVLIDFLEKEKRLEEAGTYENMRFVGYVLELGFEKATIITSDPFKKAVGGIPRGTFLIMAPDDLGEMPPHFSLLRVTATAPTPLSKEVQQTYFELHKKSMPELDVWTRSELQWGALDTQVLGMYFPDIDQPDKPAFSGDVNNVVSAHRYKVYAPTKKLLDLIINGTVRPTNQFPIGKLRFTECTLPFADIEQPQIDVRVSIDDFKGFRTAMFGKTRLGKSNVVKIIAQSIIEATKKDKSVGQLIFDVNGEYANDNPQDGSRSLRSVYQDRCEVYALNQRPETPSKPLKLNFYEQPDSCIRILRSLLAQDNRDSIYIENFASLELPNISDIPEIDDTGERIRAVRKVQMYWAILHKAGYASDPRALRALELSSGTRNGPSHFNPHFNRNLINAACGDDCPFVSPCNIDELVQLLEAIQSFKQSNPNARELTSSSGKSLFAPDDEALLNFLKPSSGSAGPRVIQPYRRYHDPNAGNFVKEILAYLDEGKTVILDLGNASDEIRTYFSDLLSRAVFNHQEQKFTGNRLGNHFIQLYFEEAHNLFPKDDRDFTGVYTRFAKEGAKFHIGIVYSTQSPSTINRELLVQTENFFVAHISSQSEVDTLAKLQFQFDGLQRDILSTLSLIHI